MEGNVTTTSPDQTMNQIHLMRAPLPFYHLLEQGPYSFLGSVSLSIQ